MQFRLVSSLGTYDYDRSGGGRCDRLVRVWQGVKRYADTHSLR